YAYNHAGWYVQSVLLRAQLIAGLPAGVIGSLTGLTEGQFPLQAAAHYRSVRAGADRTHLDVFTTAGAAAVAVQDGRITGVGTSPVIGHHLRLQDKSGNTYPSGPLTAPAPPAPQAGARVTAGTAIGNVAASPQPSLEFEIRPAGRRAPLIDPKPLL